MSKIHSLDAKSEDCLVKTYLHCFCTPKVTNKGKMLKRNDFMKAEVTHSKHIAYEVICIFFYQVPILLILFKSMTLM